MERVDVNLLRERQLAKMKDDVDRAFINRSQERFIPELETSIEGIDRTRKKRQKFQGRGDITLVVFEDLVERPHQVTVENSHEYKALLVLAIKKIYQFGKLNDVDIEGKAEEILEHEYAHHIHVLGVDGLKVYYGVGFYEDVGTGVVGLRPFIHITGTMPIDLYRDYVGGLSDPSYSDMILKDI